MQEGLGAHQVGLEGAVGQAAEVGQAKPTVVGRVSRLPAFVHATERRRLA
jgi:hypothetical protein